MLVGNSGHLGSYLCIKVGGLRVSITERVSKRTWLSWQALQTQGSALASLQCEEVTSSLQLLSTHVGEERWVRKQLVLTPFFTGEKQGHSSNSRIIPLLGKQSTTLMSLVGTQDSGNPCQYLTSTGTYFMRDLIKRLLNSL